MQVQELVESGTGLIAWAVSDAGRRHPDLAVRCLVVAQLCGLAALIKLTQQLKEGGYA